MKSAKSDYSISKSTRPDYLAEPGSNWATAYAALELFFQGKTKIAFHDILDKGSRVISNGWVVRAKGLKSVEQIENNIEMVEKEDEKEMYERDDEEARIMDELDDEMVNELDDAGMAEDEEQESWEDESIEDEEGDEEQKAQAVL